eukprot:6465226-Amphidinium_carterae.2
MDHVLDSYEGKVFLLELTYWWLRELESLDACAEDWLPHILFGSCCISVVFKKQRWHMSKPQKTPAKRGRSAVDRAHEADGSVVKGIRVRSTAFVIAMDRGEE